MHFGCQTYNKHKTNPKVTKRVVSQKRQGRISYSTIPHIYHFYRLHTICSRCIATDMNGQPASFLQAVPDTKNELKQKLKFIVDRTNVCVNLCSVCQSIF